jgi:short-subunit dehydrogenase
MTMNSKKTALITGASGGIGYELAWLFARDSYDLVLVARNEQQLRHMANKLQEVHDITVKVMVKDLALACAPDEIFADLQHDNITIDVLVNNAGFGNYGLFAEHDLNTELQMCQVNMVALTHLTGLLLPGMLEKRAGKILNLASLAAFEPGPLMAVYFATKAYVLSFSEALSNELKGTGISVTVLCPGFVTTCFHKRAGADKSKMMQMPMSDAKTVAQLGYRALMRGKVVVVTGLINKVTVLALRFSPRALTRRSVRFLIRPA